jgi:hypothetical protein
MVKAQERKSVLDVQKKFQKIEAARRSQRLKERFFKERENHANALILKASGIFWASQITFCHFVKNLSQEMISKKERFFEFKRKLLAVKVIQKAFRRHLKQISFVNGQRELLITFQYPKHFCIP